jgi:uncharacterized membrane protein
MNKEKKVMRTIRLLLAGVLLAAVAAAQNSVVRSSQSLNSAVIGQTVFAGTVTLGTATIASGTCATTVTVPATGVAATDAITASFNSDPQSITGYKVSASGILTIFVFPAANTINVEVCNNTAGAITPQAATLNLRVAR